MATARDSDDWYTPATATARASPFAGAQDLERGSETKSPEFGNLLTGKGVAAALVDTMFESTKYHVGGWRDAYTNVELLRPYFDVEPKEVIQRLTYSLMAKPTLSTDTLVALPDMYGPLMLVFTLAAILQMGMKMGNAELKEGTLVGTSLGSAFSYWVFGSGFYWTVCYVFDVQMRLLQILCVTGYAMFGYCLTLLVGYFFGTVVFTLGLLGLGGLSAVSLGLVFFYNTSVSKKGITAGTIVAIAHFTFLLYLRFWYGAIYAAVAADPSTPVVPPIALPLPSPLAAVIEAATRL